MILMLSPFMYVIQVDNLLAILDANLHVQIVDAVKTSEGGTSSYIAYVVRSEVSANILAPRSRL